MKEEGELVGSGSFRVDKARMLRVLSAYQLGSPRRFAGAWLRCAAASGAPGVTLDRAHNGYASGFDFSFAGRPFPAEELADLYGPLLAGGNSPGRFLAAGLLVLLNDPPVSITISSGGAAVRVTRPGAANPAEPLAPGRTVLRVSWSGGAGIPFSEVRALAEAELEAYPADFTCDGRSVTAFGPAQAGPSGLFFEAGLRRGVVVRKDHSVTPLTGFHPEQDSDVSVSVLGVPAERAAWRLPLVPVSVVLNDDGLDLDASMSACVRNERWEEMRAFVENKARDLLHREIALQHKAFAALGGGLKDPEVEALWRARMKWDEAWRYAAEGGWKELYLPAFLRRCFPPRRPPPAAAADFYNTGFRTWWLQDACRRALKGRSSAPEAPYLRELWEAPVLLSCGGRPLGLAEVHGLWAKRGIAVSRSGAAGPPTAVWLSSFRDERFLAEWIPKRDWKWV